MEKVKFDEKYLNIDLIKSDYEKYCSQIENVRTNAEYDLIKEKADVLYSLISAFLSKTDMVNLYVQYKYDVSVLTAEITKLKNQVKKLKNKHA